jgi:hypothetical protein
VLFARDDLIEAIDELVGRLVEAGAEAQIRVVGGAAVAIDHGRSLSTATSAMLVSRTGPRPSHRGPPADPEPGTPPR